MLLVFTVFILMMNLNPKTTRFNFLALEISELYIYKKINYPKMGEFLKLFPLFGNGFFYKKVKIYKENEYQISFNCKARKKVCDS